ncbi:hypothetical protein NM208_g8836 [Fusarium decemcellulare]|uniref:Uncharacterized protein n=1 Tax=Fusarium decemcellulare TaxID=57161 RepID=A0ACC1S3S6_9HYPO|nr:hypothetical protein NM208_g8836 [Fusarium decemcellulare]
MTPQPFTRAMAKFSYYENVNFRRSFAHHRQRRQPALLLLHLLAELPSTSPSLSPNSPLQSPSWRLELSRIRGSWSSSTASDPGTPAIQGRPPTPTPPEHVVQREEEDNGRSPDDISLLDWPSFVRQQIPDTSLRVILHAVHSDDWARATTKVQLTTRLVTLFTRFGLGTKIQEPWLLFLYLGQTVPFGLRLVKALNAWISENDHIESALVLSTITKHAIDRHGRQHPMPYIILGVDVERAMQHLSQQHPRPAAVTSSRIALRSQDARVTLSHLIDVEDESRGSVDRLEQTSNNSAASVSRSLRPSSAGTGFEDNQSQSVVSNRRKRPRQDYRESSARTSATPEIGRRGSQGTPFTSPPVVPDISLSRLVSPDVNLSGRSAGRRASPEDGITTLGKASGCLAGSD